MKNTNNERNSNNEYTKDGVRVEHNVHTNSQEHEMHCVDGTCANGANKTPNKKGGIAGKLLTLLALAVLGGLGLNYFQGNQAADFEVQQALNDGTEINVADGSVTIGVDGRPIQTGKNYKWECTANGWVNGIEEDETGVIFHANAACDDSINYSSPDVADTNCTTATNVMPSSRSCPGGTDVDAPVLTGGPITNGCQEKNDVEGGPCEVKLVYSCRPLDAPFSDYSFCYGDFMNESSCDDLTYSGSLTVEGGTIVGKPVGFIDDAMPNQPFMHNDVNSEPTSPPAPVAGDCSYTNTQFTCTGVAVGAYGNTDNPNDGKDDDRHNVGFYVKNNSGCEGVSVIGTVGTNGATPVEVCEEPIESDTCDGATNGGSSDGGGTDGQVVCCDQSTVGSAYQCPTDFNGAANGCGTQGTTVSCCDGTTAPTLSQCPTDHNGNGATNGCGTQGTTVSCCDGTTAPTLSQCPTDHNGNGATNGCGTHTSGGIPGCMDNAARNYNSNATSDNNSCRYSGCSGNQCKNDFTTAQAASCSSNAECTPNAVCDGNMVVDVNQPIACGEEGTIDVTVTNVNGANVSIVCDGVASFGTQSADMDHDMEMMECTDAMQSIYDTVTANLNKEALGVIHGDNNQLEKNNIATALANEYGLAPYAVSEAIDNCGTNSMNATFATQQATGGHDLMAYCNVFGDCSEWTVNLTHEVTRHWYFKLYDSANTLVGEGEGPQSTAANNFYSGPWLTQPAPGLITVKLYLNPEGTGPHKTLTFDAPTNCGSCDDTFPTIDPNTICENDSETVTNDCGSTLTVNGTKTDGSCQTCDMTYQTIDLTEICEGDSEVVRNDCGMTKYVRGTKNCGGTCSANPTTIKESFPIPTGATSCVVNVNYDSTTCKNCGDSQTVVIVEDTTNAPGTTCDDGDALTTDDAINEDCVCEGTPLDPVDCEVSAFTAWVCDEETDVRSRSRTITVQPANGGAECPALEQEKPCLADDYDLALRKTLVPNDKGYFVAGDDISFDVTVFNQGDVTAGGIVITDYLPQGLTFIGTDSQLSGGGVGGGAGGVAFEQQNYVELGVAVGPDESETVRFNFRINENFDGLSIENIAEISADDGDDCDSTPDNIFDNDGNIINDAIGDGCNEGGDEDDHDNEIVLLEICNGLDDNGNGDTDEGFDDMAPGMTCDDGDANTANDVYNEMCVCAGINIVDEDEYDLALMKDLADGQSRTVSAGDEVTFTITITNQGDITANNYELVDHLPAGLTLNDADWTDLGSNDATIAITRTLVPGASTTVDITTTVNAGVNGELINVVEISSDDGDDVDSAVSNDNGDQSEDDEDAEPLNVVSGEVCDGVDNNGNGTVDEGFEDMAEGTSCDDGRARTYNDTYNDVCECVGIVASGGSGGGNNYCGDGVVRAGEECDDGNYDNGDGCNSNCEIEGFCGDGLMNVVGEQCDDGNITSNDGCSATCLTEIILVCGDSAVNQEWEDCDDGNTIDGDGCSATCQLEIEEDIVSQILELKKEPVVVPPRVITPLALPIELPQTGADLAVSMCVAK